MRVPYYKKHSPEAKMGFLTLRKIKKWVKINSLDK